jgi:hypothetical protein
MRLCEKCGVGKHVARGLCRKCYDKIYRKKYYDQNKEEELVKNIARNKIYKINKIRKITPEFFCTNCGKKLNLKNIGKVFLCNNDRNVFCQNCYFEYRLDEVKEIRKQRCIVCKRRKIKYSKIKLCAVCKNEMIKKGKIIDKYNNKNYTWKK